MNVLMISGDAHMLVPGTEPYRRLELQRAEIDRLGLFVWPRVHSAREILRAARAASYAVVTAQDPFWRGLLAWRAARRAGAKLDLQVHADLSGQSFARRMLARFLLRRADSVRVVSERLRTQVRALGVTVPVHVLPVYVDVGAFRALSPLPHSRKTILWIGRFEEEKDPLFAVRILEHVRAGGIDAKLVMLGAGRLEPDVRERAHELPIELPGWRDPKPYLQTADVVLSTSRAEGWGANIVEALAAGVPVVAPDVGIAREAGAIIAERSRLADAVIEALRSGVRGVLRLDLPDAPEWARRWKETLA